MHRTIARMAVLMAAALPACANSARAQTQMSMPTVQVGGAWTLTGMAQAFPVVTFGAPDADEGDPLRRTSVYLTQPAVMANLESPSQRLVLRTTLNFEGLTQEDGELTFGGWGEGFIDSRHPHTLVHELMLSLNLWEVAGGSASLSVGKGFAPYGTSDPMARPGLKYPTNHHLSQILERWTLNGTLLVDRWSLEAGVFGGQEPEGPYDFSNIESFGDSWSVRVARRFGSGSGPAAEWEAAASFGSITEYAHTVRETTRLVNAALRHAAPLGRGHLYALAEGSQSFLAGHEDFFSLLAEARYQIGGHQPYARVEYAARPEYAREGAPGEDGFFRYEHHEDPIGTTRWLIATAAYAYELSAAPWGLRPFVEVQHHQVRGDAGGIVATDLFGRTRFWAVSVGARVFLGGGPMRMGTYGVLDAMTAMRREMAGMEGMEGMEHLH
ncbi:MAG TPA: hypothetical protein VMM35_10435 [Longimicrobiales bacterium]|nr:hypothetical protein [Longimicrobiales bacterium]